MSEQAKGTRSSGDMPTLTIAFVNNMPKSAFVATDRQFSRRLSTSSGAPRVRVIRFALDEQAARAEGYSPLRDLWRTSIDALVVSGSEPRQARLREESYWPELSQLASWAQEKALSSIWSCLAAHAAALALDGLERRPIGFKRSGVFACEIAEPHRLVARWRGPFHVPHSRLNELAEADLASAGYRILTRSQEAGADVVLRPGSGSFVLLQGHPEYDPSSLLFEYRRDMKRWLAGESSFTPAPPQHFFSPWAQAAVETAARKRDEARLEEILRDPSAPDPAPWTDWSSTFYANWLAFVADLKAQRAVGARTSSVHAVADEGAVEAARPRAAASNFSRLSTAAARQT